MKNILNDNSTINGECIEWTGKLNTNGYGIFYLNRKVWLAHRASYFVNYGNIPDNLYICHKCDNKKCININHLYAGTAKNNSMDFMKSNQYETMKLNMKKTRELTRKRKKDFENLISESHDFLSIRQFADLINAHPNSVRNMIKKGTISAFRMKVAINSSYRIPRTEAYRLCVINLEEVVNKLVDEKIVNNLIEERSKK